MTTKERITVTLSPDVLSAARNAAGNNVSAYIERALLNQSLMDDAHKLAAYARESAADREEFISAALADRFGDEASAC